LIKIKTLTIISISIIAFSFFVGSSYGNVAPKEHPSLPEVSLQLLIRNSDGQLVAYVEPTLMYIRNLNGVHEYLDRLDNRTVITKDGKNYEVFEFGHIDHFYSMGQKAGYGIVHKGDYVLLFNHNGYISYPGDSLTISWKITRTIN